MRASAPGPAPAPVDDLLAVIDHLGLDRPVAGGHCLGGAVTILAEQQRPGTFAGI